jgi:hemerythrin-like metal-binding protein
MLIGGGKGLYRLSRIRRFPMTTVNTRWNESLSLGVPEIDAQHKGFLDIISEACKALTTYQAVARVEDLLARLEHYTVSHFADEEALMAQHAFPSLDGHRESHALFINRVQELREKVAVGERVGLPMLHLLSDWLAFHINQADRHFVNFVRRQEDSLISSAPSPDTEHHVVFEPAVQSAEVIQASNAVLQAMPQRRA